MQRISGQKGIASGAPPLALVVMGVAGSGKSTVARRLARTLGARFIEGDRLHPPANVARMASGQPLTDAHREGWLDAVAREIVASVARGDGAVAACSALKRLYRDRLRMACGTILFVHLDVARDVAGKRVAGRRSHFMPASLVDSQFATLEPPGDDEAALVVDATLPIDAIVASAVARLNANAPGDEAGST